VFDKVGVFSGSLWWRSKDLAKGYTDADRIAHALFKVLAKLPIGQS
jgi:enterochelin esterase family protein